MKIVIVGAGYVGFSTAVLLSTCYEVVVVDIDSKIEECVRNKVSPFEDPLISEYLNEKDLKLRYSDDLASAVPSADYCFLALPTNFDETTGFFDTNLLDRYIEEITAINPELVIVIKSTVPFGFTETMKTKYDNENIVFVPEFLREGRALEDSLNPSRIVIGGNPIQASYLCDMLGKALERKNFETVQSSASEAEAIKLFSNTFLATRVSFFNELDSFAIKNNLAAEKIIRGVCLDHRIGDFYNNPSFGFGGYCLPKDTKQTAALLEPAASPLIQSLTASNFARKEYIARDILSAQAKTVGIYRLIMKAGSDNFRETAISDVIGLLRESGQHMLIYEPLITEKSFFGAPVVSSFDDFVKASDLIVANRLDGMLEGFEKKVYSRDIYSVD